MMVTTWATQILKSYKFNQFSTSIYKTVAGNKAVRSISTCPLLREKSNYSTRYYYNMDPKHFAEDSTCPPINENKLRIYSMRYCPYAQRAILVALAKEITHDVVNCNLKYKAEWLLERNPLGKVPVLELTDGKIICESLIVSDYLDEVYDESRALHSLDPVKKAIDRMWIERFGRIIATFYKVLFAIRDKDNEALEKHFQRFVNGSKDFEKELASRATTYFGGNDWPGMLDYMIWPWYERFPAFKTFVPSKYSGELENLAIPTINKWQEYMKEDFAVKEFLLPIEVHKEFIQSFLDKSPNYNILDAKF